MNIKIRFGEKVKEYRIKKGLSQEALANLAEIDRTYLPSIEKGKTNVSIVIAEKIANALEIDIKKFFE